MKLVLRNLDRWDTVGVIEGTAPLIEQPRLSAPRVYISGAYGRVGGTTVGLCLIEGALFLLRDGRLEPIDWEDRVEYREVEQQSFLVLSTRHGEREIARYPTPRPDGTMRQDAFWTIEQEDVGRWVSNVTSSAERKAVIRQVWSSGEA